MSTVNPAIAVRLADDAFAPYVLDSEYAFEVRGYACPQIGKPVAQWPVQAVAPYQKCYGIDPDEFRSYRDKDDSAIFVAWLDGRPVGHVVVSTNWNGLAHVDELAVHAPARRHGVARALLGVTQWWARKKRLPGIMLETQNNNLAACRLYEGFGFELGGIDHLRYRGIDPQTSEVAMFWYLMF
ncbi:GNAT family N-acetyltransferase [Pseudomonas sp. App30]|uniref:GNAT family N-acetyltransferase n=1 Tax=Pseudomonas sp. App30 TaxID=3068990 RepID=UPI003A7FEEA8